MPRAVVCAVALGFFVLGKATFVYENYALPLVGVKSNENELLFLKDGKIFSALLHFVRLIATKELSGAPGWFFEV